MLKKMNSAGSQRSRIFWNATTRRQNWYELEKCAPLSADPVHQAGFAYPGLPDERPHVAN